MTNYERELKPVKAFLKECRRLDNEINSLQAQRDQIKAMLTSTTAQLSADVVSSTKNPHKFDKLVELDELIDERIDLLCYKKKQTIIIINQLEDTRLRNILIAHYINGDTFERIACEMHYDWRHIMRLHGDALEQLRKITGMR